MENDKQDIILSKLHDIESQINEIQSTNTRMNDHITFIESVYNTIKKPFFAIMNAVSMMVPSLTIEDSEHLKYDCME